jgi:hypothetical protein
MNGEIQHTEMENAVEIRSIVSSLVSATGRFRFGAVKHDAQGSANVVQMGEFILQADQAEQLAEICFPISEQACYEAYLHIEWEHGQMDIKMVESRGKM